MVLCIYTNIYITLHPTDPIYIHEYIYSTMYVYEYIYNA